MNRFDGYITVDGLETDINIHGTVDQNRAVDGDVVVVEIHPQTKWKTKGRAPATIEQSQISVVPRGLWNPLVVASEPEAAKAPHAAFSASLADLQRRLRGSSLQPTAAVVHIAEHAGRRYIGTIRTTDSAALFDAKDPRLPRGIRIPHKEMPEEYQADPVGFAADKLCIVKLGAWATTHRSPQGIFVQATGQVGAITPEIEALLIAANVQEHLLPFSAAVEASLPAAAWMVPDEEVARRRDLRNWTIFSIDPWNARDLDDAMSVCALDDGTFEIGVHIADVAHFVTEGSPVDLQAKQRCTSVYLVNQVVWRMHADGMFVVDAPIWYGKTIIRSVCQLDYGSAQRLIDLPLGDAPQTYDEETWPAARRPMDTGLLRTVHENVQQLWRIGMARRRVRFATGAVSLQNTKLSFVLDESTGAPVSVASYPIRDSNRLIEEFMLVANYLVAQKLLLAPDNVAVLRHHPSPNAEQWPRAWEMLAAAGIGKDPNVELSVWLDEIKETRGPALHMAVMHVLTKPMQTAEYNVVTRLTTTDRHFALNLPYYTHFTSPIRRYADVLVHRLLLASLTGERVEIRGEDVERCNAQKLNAKTAQQSCDKLFLAMLLLKTPVETAATVVGIGPKSFTLLITEYGFEQRMFLDKMDATGTLDATTNRLRLVLREKKLDLTLFSAVRVQLSATKDTLDVVVDVIVD
ncbi:DIS3-like exonuclease 2-like [Achlya hypogyna]|uniref:DIS3-like exonuclease 2-like n=1 Tax=Achlya hypogyna TaxID=1202772 RepID=A0A1V9Z7P1_ACHHY|nr:DIS3-like exonuclease 2-like [Achlya hypogyna]